MANNEHITRLFKKYLADDYTKAELDELLRYFKLTSDEGQLDGLIARELDGIEGLDADRQALIDSISDTIERRVFSRTHPRPKRKLLRWLPYAAAVAIALAVGWLTMGDRWMASMEQVADIAPGGNRATLTLANGQTIDLSHEQTGIIIGDGVTYQDGSNVILNNSTASLPPTTEYTLMTPRGGQYQVTLPDGSSVWLNANSTLKYPSRFSAAERVVFLEGEAYFDVRQIRQSKEQRLPFKVVTAGQTVEVLGTQFNLSAYPDEAATKTTLVEGRVRVAPTTGHGITISPGEQSSLVDGTLTKATVDLFDHTGWKDGWIILRNSDIKTVIRQLERWYDVTFDVTDWPTELRLEGEIQRNSKLSSVVDALELNTGKQLYIEGRRVMEKR